MLVGILVTQILFIRVINNDTLFKVSLESQDRHVHVPGMTMRVIVVTGPQIRGRSGLVRIPGYVSSLL
jgi:hypothetical protein